MQGALGDLSVANGIFASATEFTRPAKRYAFSSSSNPLHKEIELYHIRPSTQQDEKGRLNKIIVNMTMHLPDYSHGRFNPCFTENGIKLLKLNGWEGKTIKLKLDFLYDSDGKVINSIEKLSRFAPPDTNWEKGFIAKACWLLFDTYLNIEGLLYPIYGIEYEIPFLCGPLKELVIEMEGTPKIYIRSENGSIDKLITDDQMRKIKFDENGAVNELP